MPGGRSCVSTTGAAIFRRVVPIRSPAPARLLSTLAAAVGLLLANAPLANAQESCVELGPEDPSLGELGPRVVAVLERVLSRDARGLRRLSTPEFRDGMERNRLQNDLDLAAARGLAVTHLEELRVWRLAPSSDGAASRACGSGLGPWIDLPGEDIALLAIAEGPREGQPSRGRVALLLKGEGLALDYLHLSPATLGSRRSSDSGEAGAGILVVRKMNRRRKGGDVKDIVVVRG